MFTLKQFTSNFDMLSSGLFDSDSCQNRAKKNLKNIKIYVKTQTTDQTQETFYENYIKVIL